MKITSDIVSRAQRGEIDALRSVYEQTVSYLSVVCSRYIADGEESKDILQDVYLKAFRSLDKFTYKGEGSLRAWISRIAVNEAVNRLREKKKLSVFNEDVAIPDIADDEPPDIESIAESDILEAIHSLPEGYRTVFNLYLFEKKSHKEIASMLGISEGTSASQYHRAKAMLAKKIKEKIKQ